MKKKKTQEGIRRPCGCVKKKCSFGECQGYGAIAILETIPEGYQVKKRVKAVMPQEDGSFIVESYCLTNGWQKEIMPSGSIRAMVAK